MTEKRTMPESHEQRCRELAELTSGCTEDKRPCGGEGCDCPHRAHDPRFASLRGKHSFIFSKRCDNCNAAKWAAQPTYCLRTNLGAIVIAFGAMDTPVTFACDDDEVWSAVPVQKQRNGGGIPFITNGASPEDAGSAALWLLVFGA